MNEITRGRRVAGRILMTLTAWLAAYLIVTLLLLVAGPWLESVPVAVRALLISGVLVTAMTNLVMPALGRASARAANRARQET
jgi:antibiotic biosynthesis monooxygenase (ABM) superfamily enzyme